MTTPPSTRTVLVRLQEQLNCAERAIYVGKLAQAQMEFQHGNGARALQILDSCPANLRHLEHHLLWTLSSVPCATFPDTREASAASPSARTATVSLAAADGTARLWDSRTGRELFVLRGHAGFVWSACFSPDGKRLLTASQDGTLRLWDPATGQGLRTLRGHTDAVLCVAFSPDGRRLLSASADNSARVWDPDTGQELFSLRGHLGPVASAAFSPDGTVL